MFIAKDNVVIDEANEIIQVHISFYKKVMSFKTQKDQNKGTETSFGCEGQRLLKE